MTGKERVAAAMSFQQPDRVPRFWGSFWAEFEQNWRERHGMQDLYAYFGEDMRVVAADESPWPSRSAVLEDDGTTTVVRTGWGDIKRTRSQATYGQQVMGVLIRSAVPERVDPDKMAFEDPLREDRYSGAAELVAAHRATRFVMCKTGGPYLRTAFLRGEEALWVDVVEDPEWVRQLAERVADHLILVGVESLRRFDLGATGIAIYDDVAAGWGPFIGPARYEQIFLPVLRRMVLAYKAAGAARVMHHSDGNVAPLLDMWIDAGVDAINSVEYRGGLDPVAIKERYPGRLVCVGGLDNCGILPRGDRAEVRDHVLHLLEAGRGGGYVLGPHSIGPDIKVETMEFVLELLDGG